MTQKSYAEYQKVPNLMTSIHEHDVSIHDVFGIILVTDVHFMNVTLKKSLKNVTDTSL